MGTNTENVVKVKKRSREIDFVRAGGDQREGNSRSQFVCVVQTEGAPSRHLHSWHTGNRKIKGIVLCEVYRQAIQLYKSLQLQVFYNIVVPEEKFGTVNKLRSVL